MLAVNKLINFKKVERGKIAGKWSRILTKKPTYLYVKSVSRLKNIDNRNNETRMINTIMERKRFEEGTEFEDLPG